MNITPQIYSYSKINGVNNRSKNKTPSFAKALHSYKPVPMDNWSRKEIYSTFSQCEKPFWSVTSEIDVSKLLNVAEKKGIPNSQAILYMIGRAVNDIDNFKYRKENGKVVKYDQVDLGMTIGTENNLFTYSNIEYYKDPQKFFEKADAKVEKAKKSKNLFQDEARNDIIYLSCLPWVKFTSMTNPIHHFKNDAFPRIVWGKYDNGKMPISVEVNHAFIDGYHVGLFFNKLQENFNNAESIFKDVKMN